MISMVLVETGINTCTGSVSSNAHFAESISRIRSTIDAVADIFTHERGVFSGRAEPIAGRDGGGSPEATGIRGYFPSAGPGALGLRGGG